ncbi:MAG: hypothetical protein GXY83_25620 [Rhodopirellula sp.]|nr:hypothetical protein [Rhodopirellula sp.]
MAHTPKYRRHPNGQAFVEHQSIPGRDHRLYLGLHRSEDRTATGSSLGQLTRSSSRSISAQAPSSRFIRLNRITYASAAVRGNRVWTILR